MIKMNWAQIRNPSFNPVLGKVMRAKMPYASAKRMLDILTRIREEQQKSDELWAHMVERYLEPIPENEGMMQIRASFSDAERAQARRTIEEFMATPVEIQIARLVPQEIALVELSAVELLQLEGMIED